ncbi:hypothetical protein [Pseudomonas asiatica]|uniref:hypothetical protein n=1 Tax=Pseudomonas asiatica TaxID=2219225 RepID=UPI003BA1313D|nr:hypothetical protein [Pseudomonas shirazica]
MPTENRSSNTDPRDVFIRLNPLGLGEEELRKDTTGFEDQRTHSDYLLFLAGYRESHQDTQRHGELPAVSIPDGYCLMPRQLTAENGAKALLLGEFKLEVACECPECRELEEPTGCCEICDGEGEYAQRHTIPWDQIKLIYSEAVKGLALQPNTAR